MSGKAFIKSAIFAMVAILVSPGLVHAKATVGGSGGLSLTPVDVNRALKADTIDQLLKNIVGTPPSASGIAKLSAFLRDLVSSDPSLAGETANAVAALAWDTAADDPESALAMAKLAMAVASNPAVMDSATDQAVETLVTVAGANQLAIRSAAAKGVTLAGTDALKTEIQALTVRLAEIIDESSKLGESALPILQSRIDESIKLADAQADLAGFTTAAGPGDIANPLGAALREFETATGDEASPTGL